MKTDATSANAVSKRNHSENFSALLCEQMFNEKAPDDETKTHSRTSPETSLKETNAKFRATSSDQQSN